MKVLVLNGSPKGEYSITLQTVRYLEILYSQHTFEVIHVGQRIRGFEKDFTPALEAVERADLLLFCYPVYTFIVPSQLHRFIELLKEHKVSMKGKFATQISTSKHFYDVTAHRFIQDNCQDMGLKYIRGLSADMDDLTLKKGQQEAKAFWEYVCYQAEHNFYEPDYFVRTVLKHMPVTIPEDDGTIKKGDVVIVTDCEEDNHQLAAMIARFRTRLPYNTRVVNIREYNLHGGCLGCFNCAIDGKCVYKDGFDEYLRNHIQKAQAIIYACSVRDHSMGSRFKMYDDRQFCNGHRTVTIGMPMGYLISGNYAKETNLQTILEARAQVGSNIFVGVATDELRPDYEIDKLAANLTYALRHKNAQPQNFYGIGGMKIFRDLIYQMQGMMQADHKFYKAHGQYDFPQKNKGLVIKMYLVGALLASPKIKAKMGNKMNEGMIMPYKKVLEQARRENI